MAGYGKGQQKNAGMTKLFGELKQGIFRQVYLLYGEERYLVLQAKDQVLASALRPDDQLNLNIHKGAGPDLSKITDECLAVPFFAERRVVLVQDSGYFASGKGTSGASEDLIRLLGQVPSTTLLLFVEDAVDKRSRAYKALAKAGMAVSFDHPDEATLTRWMMTRLKASHIRITKDALELLLTRTGVDMTMISSQLDKLISCVGEGGTLTGKEVGGLVQERLETRVFDLVDAVGTKNRRAAMDKYDQLIRTREEPSMILYFLARQFNQLYQTKLLEAGGKGAPEMMKALNLKYSFQLRKLCGQARYFQTDLLRQAVEDCVDMETRFKSGRIEGRLAVELLLVRYSE